MSISNIHDKTSAMSFVELRSWKLRHQLRLYLHFQSSLLFDSHLQSRFSLPFVPQGLTPR